MQELIAWIGRIVNSWKFWIVVAPWEVAVRVRLGKTAKALGPGPHFRIPVLDQMMLVNTRLRVLTTPAVTIRNTNSGLARIHRATVGYVIVDPVLAVRNYNRPEIAVMGLIQAKLAAREPEEGLRKALSDLESNGIKVVFTQLVEDVDVPTIRLLQGGSDVWGAETGPPTVGAGGPQSY